MAKKSSPLIVDVAGLPEGFHHRRIERKGVGFDTFIWRGKPGPVLLINAATHGDEYEGPTILQQWVKDWQPRGLRGTVIFVPVLNEGAFFAGLRCNPEDGKNLARSFPGEEDGTITPRLARLFDEELLAQATHYVDLHSAGVANELMPWVGYMTQMPAPIEKVQRAMANCFDRFWLWSGPYLPGRTLSAAADRKIPAIYTECRGAGGVSDTDLAALDQGLKHLMVILGILAGKKPALRKQPTRITRSSKETHLQVHHQAPHDGLFVPAVKLGAKVANRMIIGEVLSLNGIATAIKAEHSGKLVMIRVQRSVRQGDALAVLAPI